MSILNYVTWAKKSQEINNYMYDSAKPKLPRCQLKISTFFRLFFILSPYDNLIMFLLWTFPPTISMINCFSKFLSSLSFDNSVFQAKIWFGVWYNLNLKKYFKSSLPVFLNVPGSFIQYEQKAYPLIRHLNGSCVCYLSFQK